MKKILLLITCGLLLAAVACGGRLPKANVSEGLVKQHFKHYGKKFKESDFGTHKIESISIIDTKELHKNMVAVMSDVKLVHGPAYRVRVVMGKKTLGWKILSWEKL